MASFRKNSLGKWEVQVARKGVRRSGTFDTKAEATQWANKIEADILGGKKGAADKTLGDLLTRYQKEVVPQKGSYEIESRRIDKLLRSELAKLKLRDLDATHFVKWRNARAKEVSPGTVIRDIASMTRAISIAINEWKWLDESPIKGVARPKAPPGRDRRISDGEIDRVLLAAGYDYQDKPETVSARTGAAFLFAIETAMRDGELASLTMDRVFLDKRYVHIRAQDTKSRVKRDVPLSAEAIRIIKQMNVTEGLVFGLTSQQITRAFIRIKEACLIKDMKFHDTRHEAITRLSQKMGVLELSRTVGHRNLNQLLTYYNTTAEELAGKL